MRMTYIGHLSHLFEDGDTKFLMDPLLQPTFGEDYSPRPVEMFPPRNVDCSALAEVDVVLVTHEHFDHFNLRSLSLLPRTAEIIVGPNMLSAVVRSIEALGFTVTRRDYERAYRVGSIEYTLFPAAPDTAHWEKRVSQILLRGDSGGSILLGVDALFGDAAAEAARAEPPTVIAVANNAQITPPRVMGALTNYAERVARRPVPDGVRLVGSVLAAVDEWPELLECNLSITGGGFRKDYDAIGVFPLAEQDVVAALARDLTGRSNIFGPTPGEVYELRGDTVQVLDRAEWVTVDEQRLAELQRQRSDFIERAGVIDRSWVVQPAAEDAEKWGFVVQELQALAKFMLLNPLGAEVLEAAKSADDVFLFRVVNDFDDSCRTFGFDAVNSAFVHRPALDDTSQSDLCSTHSFGVVVSLSDFIALCEGRIQIWDLAGIAIDAWYANTRIYGPTPLMYTWWGEQAVAGDFENLLKLQLSTIGSGS